MAEHQRAAPRELPEPVRHAITQAGRETGVPASAVELVDYEPINWPDASLGVPLPGRLFAQMITPGYRVRLTVAGRPLEYHTDRGRRVVRISPTVDNSAG